MDKKIYFITKKYKFEICFYFKKENIHHFEKNTFYVVFVIINLKGNISLYIVF